MPAYITTVTEDEGKDPIETQPISDTVGIYRKDGERGNIFLRTPDEDIDLGFHDRTVSRISSNARDICPVEMFDRDGSIFIRNNSNENAIEVEYLYGQREIGEGNEKKVTEDCVVKPGLWTNLRLSFKPDEADQADQLEEKGGISTVAYVELLCDGFVDASESSASNAYYYGQQLLTFAREHPVDHQSFEEAVADLERSIQNLKSDAVPTGDELNDDVIETHEQVATDISSIYKVKS
ncbi:hypothetical protein [Salinigranum halophilum]|uniref:hypothetical protein n=1 Tax=Salinigranum halophilum TaxID=2565931 RepID=UPI00115C8485|nr:hypothetical protein [Salinigranum halophilum]